MQVAIYARVSTQHQQRDGTIHSQVKQIKDYIDQQQWNLLPEHEYIDEGISGARLDRPALDRLRDSAGQGEFDAIVLLSPDRLARHYAQQWFLIEELQKVHVSVIFLQNPFGDTPQGKLLVQMQGMIAEYERAQIVERARRGQLEKARRGELIPWAYATYGYQYLPRRQHLPPQAVIQEDQAQVVRQMFRWLVEDRLTIRAITRRLNKQGIPTPRGQVGGWRPGSVRNILVNRTYTGQTRYNYRQAILPQTRRQGEAALKQVRTGRRFRPASEWIMGDAPVIISTELFDKAQEQLRHNAELSARMYRPTSERYLVRRLVKCGHCGLSLGAARQKSHQNYYLYYQCRGRQERTAAGDRRCQARSVRAQQLDQVVWEALTQLLRQPQLLPQLHQQWTQAQETNLSHVSTRHTQLLKRQHQLQRQDQRLIDAYQQDIISLTELKHRRQRLATELQHLQNEAHRLTRQQQQVIHWQRVMTHVEQFRELLHSNLDRLSFEERQMVVQCLVRQVVVTGEDVDLFLVLPFDSAPQVCHNRDGGPEGPPGQFYRLRLNDSTFLDTVPQNAPVCVRSILIHNSTSRQQSPTM